MVWELLIKDKMKIELIKTKESDGNWYKVYVDDWPKACIKIFNGREDESLKRAIEIYDFLIENKGDKQIIKSNEIL